MEILSEENTLNHVILLNRRELILLFGLVDNGTAGQMCNPTSEELEFYDKIIVPCVKLAKIPDLEYYDNRG